MDHILRCRYRCRCCCRCHFRCLCYPCRHGGRDSCHYCFYYSARCLPEHGALPGPRRAAAIVRSCWVRMCRSPVIAAQSVSVISSMSANHRACFVCGREVGTYTQASVAAGGRVWRWTGSLRRAKDELVVCASGKDKNRVADEPTRVRGAAVDAELAHSAKTR